MQGWCQRWSTACHRNTAGNLWFLIFYLHGLLCRVDVNAGQHAFCTRHWKRVVTVISIGCGVVQGWCRRWSTSRHYHACWKHVITDILVIQAVVQGWCQRWSTSRHYHACWKCAIIIYSLGISWLVQGWCQRWSTAFHQKPARKGQLQPLILQVRAPASILPHGPDLLWFFALCFKQAYVKAYLDTLWGLQADWRKPCICQFFILLTFLEWKDLKPQKTFKILWRSQVHRCSLKTANEQDVYVSVFTRGLDVLHNPAVSLVTTGNSVINII